MISCKEIKSDVQVLNEEKMTFSLYHERNEREIFWSLVEAPFAYGYYIRGTDHRGKGTRQRRRIC